jgi:hypothetical protein
MAMSKNFDSLGDAIKHQRISSVTPARNEIADNVIPFTRTKNTSDEIVGRLSNIVLKTERLTEIIESNPKFGTYVPELRLLIGALMAVEPKIRKLRTDGT